MPITYFLKVNLGLDPTIPVNLDLLITTDDLTKAVNNRQQIDIGILDFTNYKAFDKVPHLRLLHKLEYYGVTSNLLNWLTSF